jgi:hypothetical protein
MALVAGFVLGRRGCCAATSGKKAATAAVHDPEKRGRSHDT